MAIHTHTLREGPALTAAARAALESGGEQWTALRADIFAALSELGRPASAYEVTEAVSVRAGRRIAANSVYRILDLFVASNLAKRVESANAYMVNGHPGCRHDCIFLVCDGCGFATHVDDDAVVAGVRAAAAATGFAVDRPIIELRGRCARCAAA